ncbi:MAG: fibronectin type III domain-containing protein [Clostridia bacterium]|nr:fibronectin type III domain-containing protein [Clostridia bacterium]
MKKITKLLAALLVCLTVFSTVSMAAEGTLPQEETTSSVNEETTTEVQEETTAAVQEETTTEVQQETTTEPVTQPEEETTAPEEEETTTEPTTEPEEETTAPAEDETTTATPEEETTEPEKPEIVLPKAPTKIEGGNGGFGYRCVIWDEVEGADGYDIYLKVGDEWVYQRSSQGGSEYIYNLLQNSEYEVAIKSYIMVDGEKYQSEEYCTGTISTSASVRTAYLTLEATKSGIKLNWDVCEGASGYRIYVRKDNKWVKLKDINDIKETEYIYTDVKAETKYRFAIKSFVKGTKGLKWGMLTERTVTYPDFTKAKITSKSATSSSVTLKWSKVEGAGGYRVYVYKNNKWTYYKGIKTEKYTVKSLEDATNYKFKVRAFFKEDGKTIWGTYSDTITVRTDGKKVKAGRISKLKKQFTDGDWSVKINNFVFDGNEKVNLTIAVRGYNLFIRYDFKNEKETDVEYLVQLDKERVYMINKKSKTYCILPDEEAAYTAANLLVLPLIMDLSAAKGVTAKTTIYKSKKAVAEIYTDKELGIKKTYYFINDKLSGMKVVYADGSTESFSSIKINDTPSSSVFKVPSGYKKIAY